MTQTRTPLTRERVLRAALELADEGGVEAVSMRKIADQLGVKAMSLYNHVANKDDVLDGMVDATYSEIAAPTPGAEWQVQVREIAISAHEVFLSHPWAAGLQTSVKPGPGRLRYGDRLLGCFRDAGFSKQLTYHAYHIIESYILGYTSQVLAYRAVDTAQFEDVAGALHPRRLREGLSALHRARPPAHGARARAGGRQRVRARPGHDPGRARAASETRRARAD